MVHSSSRSKVNGAATADFWGTRNAGINYGMLFTAWGVAGAAVGRFLGGRGQLTLSGICGTELSNAVLTVPAGISAAGCKGRAGATRNSSSSSGGSMESFGAG